VLPQSPTGKGKLLGIPFGVKDIIETRGLATEYGSPIYKGRIGTTDAAIVRQLRERGGVLLGKTHTTAFAYSDPAPTHNPRDLAHTPGGSSSGSAAAVAAGMVPVALGTQTGGSVLRPASYCGVTGFKTTYGLLSMDGVLPFATSLDTLGFFTHTAADMLAFWGAIGQPTGRAEDVPLAVPDPAPDVEPAMACAYRDAVARLLKHATQSVRFPSPQCWPDCATRSGPSCSTKGHGFTRRASRNTARVSGRWAISLVTACRFPRSS
jgi:Asp-tRNA(Asn)/Glu-tRNA(Gln) amidotransferase A subunit family amidase